MKRAFLLLISTLLISISGYAQSVLDNGTLSDGLQTWVLYDDGTLDINGEGKIADINSTNSTAAPWGSNVAMINTLKLSGSITTIGKNVFYACTNLTKIISYIENPPTLTSSTFRSSVISSLAVLVPSDAAMSSYMSAQYWGDMNISVDPQQGGGMTNSNANLTAIYVDGTLLEGFEEYRYSYQVSLPSGTTAIPNVSYVSGDEGQMVTVDPASLDNPQTKITVMSPDGLITNTYFIFFSMEGNNGDDTGDPWGGDPDDDPIGAIVPSGSLPSGQTWEIIDGSTLYIAGGGDMQGYSTAEEVPWYNYQNQITSLYLNADFFNIGSYLFYNLSNLTEITCMSSYVPTLQSNTFRQSGLEMITLKIRQSLYAEYTTASYWKDMNIQPFDDGGSNPTAGDEYTVYWSVNGAISSTSSVEAGGFISYLPDTPTACDGYTFAGWTDAPINGSLSSQPAILYTDETQFPAVSEDITYYAVFNSVATAGGGAYEVEDVLTRELTNVENETATYVDWTYHSQTSNAMYAGNSSGGNNAIELRSSTNTSGIVTTASGGVATRLTIEWEGSNATGRAINVYGKNTHYSSPEDLYGSEIGTIIGTITYNGSGSSVLDLTSGNEYQYIGLRSSSGALYVTGITIAWRTSGTSEMSEYLTSCGNTGGDAYTVTLVRNGMSETMSVSGTYMLPAVGQEADACNGWSFQGWIYSATAFAEGQTYSPGFVTTVSGEAILEAVYGQGGSGENSATHTFTSSSWMTKESGEWTSDRYGAGYSYNGVQITTTTDDANALCPITYNLIDSVVVSYCTNASSGAGGVVISIGETNQTQAVTSTGGTTPRDISFDFSDSKPSGNPKITVNCTKNSIYICSITIYYDGRGMTVYRKSPCSEHFVSFYSNGVQIEKQSVADGSSPALPADPQACEGYVFVGWSDVQITEPQSWRPTVLYKTAAEFPAVTGDMTFYAVYALFEEAAPSGETITITSTTSGLPTAYGTANTFTEYTLVGYQFQIQQMYMNGGKMQWRAAGNTNGTGTMYNSQPFSGFISSIELKYNGSDTQKNFTVKVGNYANPTDGVSITPTESGEFYVFDCYGENANYFVLANGSGAGYLDQIIITIKSVSGATSENQYISLCAGATGGDVTDSGLIDGDLYWSFDGSTGLLSITGTGSMPDWIQSMAPWGEYLDAITQVKVGVGVTYVCNGAFAYCENITSVTVAFTVDSIGDNLFTGNNSPIQFHVQNMTPPGITENTFANVQGCVYVYCYESAYSAFESHPFWSQTCLGYDDDPHYEDYQLSAIYVNGTIISGFDPNLYNYDITLPEGSEAPVVTYEQTNADQVVTVQQASSASGTAYVNVAVGGTDMATYSIYFSVPGGNPQAQTISLILNDTAWTFVMLPSALGGMITADDIVADGDLIWGRYNGEKRAANQSGWELVDNFDVSYYKDWGHIVRAVNGDVNLTINLPESFNNSEGTLRLRAYPAAHQQNANWNFVGNPYNAKYDILGQLSNMGIESPIAVWNGTGYTTYTPGIDSYVLMPFEPFFIQVTEDRDIQLTPEYIQQ